MVHGGMLSAFMDGVLAGAVWRGTEKRAVTIHLSIDFLHMARMGEWVMGEARLTRATRDVAFAEGRAYVGGHDVVRCPGLQADDRALSDALRFAERRKRPYCCAAGASRGVAQSGSASALGAEGRVFKSRRPDHRRRVGAEVLDMLARIYQPAPRPPCSPARRKTQDWVLEFEPEHARDRSADGLDRIRRHRMRQVQLPSTPRRRRSPTPSRHGIAFQLVEPKPAKRIIKAYADNFAFDRKVPWTH